MTEESKPCQPDSPPDVEWERLISLLHTLARGVMRGRDRDRRESMDVAQSLVVDLLTQRSGLLALPIESQRRVLAVALRNKLARYARRDHDQKRQGVHIELSDGNAMPGGARNADSVLVEREELETVRQALDVLEPESRAALLLHASGATHAEIAEALQTTNQAARQRWSRAKRDLVILSRRQAGESWEAIAKATGLSAEEAEQRYERLESS